MAHTSKQHPIVVKKTQALLTSPHRHGVDTPDAERKTAQHTNPGINQPGERHRQSNSASAARPHHDRADAPADAGKPCLPTECWIG